MKRNHNVNNINLQISDIEISPKGLVIYWSSNIGFGTYALWQNDDGNWYGDSEYMDKNEDKAFIRKLMNLFVDMLDVTG